LEFGDLVRKDEQIGFERETIDRDGFRGEIGGKLRQQREQVVRADEAVVVGIRVVRVGDGDGLGRSLGYSTERK
jgi:hypothetical protein